MAAYVPVLLALFAVALPAHAQTRLVLEPGARLSLEGDSTVRKFSCQARTLKMDVRAPGNGVVVASTAPESVTLEIPTKGLDCANGTMNEHMYDALHAEKHPVIVFRMKPGASVDGEVLRLEGDLTIAGQAKPIVLEAKTTLENGALQVRGAYRLKMTDWGVRPPSLMLGTMKVRDEVLIRFDLTLRPQG